MSQVIFLFRVLETGSRDPGGASHCHKVLPHQTVVGLLGFRANIEL